MKKILIFFKTIIFVLALDFFYFNHSPATEIKGLTIDTLTSSTTLQQSINVSDSSGGPVYAIYTENNYFSPLDITINSDINASVSNATNQYPSVVGLYSENRSINNLIINSNITVKSFTGNDNKIYGTLLRDFTNIVNNGSIKIFSENVDNSKFILLFIKDNSDKLINYGSMNIQAYGDNLETYGFTGLHTDLNIFNNYGTLEIIAKSKTQASSYFFNKTDHGITKFYNSGNFKVLSESKDNSISYGINNLIRHDNSYFINDGEFNIKSISDNNLSTSETYGYYNLVLGLYDTSANMNFINNKNISLTSISGGNITSGAVYYEIFENSNLDFKNNGNITLTAQSTYNSPSIDIYALKIYKDTTFTPSFNANIKNYGNIKISLFLPKEADTSNVKSYIFHLKNASATLANYGNLVIESNIFGGDYRVLYLENSEAILQDKFAFTFGLQGVSPNQKMVYIDNNSKINLNETKIIARGDSRFLKLRTPYYVIENNGGMVLGNWGGVERGFVNNLFTSNFTDPLETGVNASIVFGYNPTYDQLSAIIPAVPSISNNLLLTDVYHKSLVNNLINNISDFSLTESEKEAKTEEKGLWAIPFYSRISNKGIDFDADIYALALGYNKKLSNTKNINFYSGYARIKNYYTSNTAVNTNSDNFIFGTSVINELQNDNYIRFNGDLSISLNKYTGKTGLNYEMKEKANYTGYGVYIESLIGKKSSYKKANVVTEIGLGYGHYDANKFKTEVEINQDFERFYDPQSLNTLRFVAFGEVSHSLTKKLDGRFSTRFEKAINKNRISVINWISGDSFKYNLTKKIYDSIFEINLGLNIKVKPDVKINITGTLGFNSEYNFKSLISYQFSTYKI